MNLIKSSTILLWQIRSSSLTITRTKSWTSLSLLPLQPNSIFNFKLFHVLLKKSPNLHAKKRISNSKPTLESTVVQQVPPEEKKDYGDYKLEYSDESQMNEDVVDGDENYDEEDDCNDEKECTISVFSGKKTEIFGINFRLKKIII